MRTGNMDMNGCSFQSYSLNAQRADEIAPFGGGRGGNNETISLDI